VVVDGSAFGVATRVGFIAQFDVHGKSGCLNALQGLVGIPITGTPPVTGR
jgi:hypothetical protein